ncbi:MAG TPA: RcnB family protein [Rhizobiaceae bacterium]|nr:RcnB family protein [Rhizobiaceae bacterium]
MKRIALAAIAFSVLAAPMAQAQPRHDGPRPHYSQKHHDKSPRHFAPGHHKQRHWSRGDRVPEWQRRHHLRDYHRYGLKRPGRHQHWVKVENDYLLVSIASGVIAAVVSGR